MTADEASAIKVLGSCGGFMQVTRTLAFGAGALFETKAADDAANFMAFAPAAFVAFPATVLQ